MRKFLIATASLLAFTAAAKSAEFHSLDDAESAIFVDGDINPGDDVRFIRFIKDRKSTGLKTEVVIINSNGGQSLAADGMAKTIYEADMKTAIAEGDTCASACVSIWAAGSERYYSTKSRIGIHSAGTKTGEENAESFAATTFIARRLIFLKAPAGIIVKLLNTKPKDIAWLSASDFGDWAIPVD